MAFDQNTYVTNKNNNGVNLVKNGDGTFQVIYTSTSSTDGSTTVANNVVSLTDLFNQQSTFQTNLANLNIMINDLRSL